MNSQDTRYVLVMGAALGFGAEVAGRLRTEGTAVVEDAASLPAGAILRALIIDLTIATGEIAFRSVTEDDFRASLNSQLYAFVAAVQSTVPAMTQGGAVVQIVPKAYLGAWGGIHIAASAAACVAMGRSMALELASLGIRVNSVATGRPGESWDNAAARADIAATIAWLASPASGQVTGETILVDRGASLRMAQAVRR